MKSQTENKTIRNIAIIAHVDHGKTTLVDAMFKQSGLFREGQNVDDRIMDNMDLERERGITISAKNCSVKWRDVKVNIIDTPGHADFGGEVERAISMADGAILLVDASEGPLPQTRFVLEKALQSGLKIIVVINKIDRKDARPDEVLNEVCDLFIDLDANDEQMEFPLIYANGKAGIAQKELNDKEENLKVLFDTIVDTIPGPFFNTEEPLQVLVSDLGYSDYLGRLAIGKIVNGTINYNEKLICINNKSQHIPLKISKLQVYDGMQYADTKTADAGEIVILSGIEEVTIGDTICYKDFPKALKRISVDEPTVSMV
ncbi:MAG: GTP-binding protein, partial [Deltaproteobacteria bacterium]|nr:GTP-binding protein [Deltaproteobacteria bacterium]